MSSPQPPSPLLTFEDYKWNIHSLLKTPETAESLVYKQSWRFVIFVEAIKAIIKWAEESKQSIPAPIRRASKLLQKLFDKPIPSIYDVIGEKILSLSTLRFPGGGTLTNYSPSISF